MTQDTSSTAPAAPAAPLAHLLIVDDDREIRDLLGRFLKKHGFRVTLAKDGQKMLAALSDWSFDLVVLDIMMPGEDGLSLCRRLRAGDTPLGRAGIALPVIMLTAVGEDVDRIIGLEMGADDYLPKPFNPRELVARIKAVLRRRESINAPPDSMAGGYLFEGFRLDDATRELFGPKAEHIELTAGEYDLLHAFVTHPRRVLSRDQLLDLARGRAAIPFDRSIDVQIGRLRRKIEPDPKNPRLIKTVRGGGYMFTPDVTHAGEN